MSAEGDQNRICKTDSHVQRPSPFSAGHDTVAKRKDHPDSRPPFPEDCRRSQVRIMEQAGRPPDGLFCIPLDEEKVYQLYHSQERINAKLDRLRHRISCTNFVFQQIAAAVDPFRKKQNSAYSAPVLATQPAGIVSPVHLRLSPP